MARNPMTYVPGRDEYVGTNSDGDVVRVSSFDFLRRADERANARSVQQGDAEYSRVFQEELDALRDADLWTK